MAWNELVASRGRGSKLFQDSGNPLKHSWDGQAGTKWHYDTVLDSGLLDGDVDMTPQRITAGGHDGWRVINNGWHYFLGNPNGLATDGWVGFGGRQGNKWLMFRLLRVGYLHWPTRAWDDIGSAPDYDRVNLTRTTYTTTVPTTQAEIPVETVADWSGLWSTPGGGDVTARWRADGNRLKEEIVLNEAGRNWIAANRPPGTPPAETYFGFVFRLASADSNQVASLDLSNLPRWLKNGVLQDTEGDFDDDDGTEGIEVQNALQEFLFFLPIDEAYVTEVDGEGNPSRTSIKLRKRIYKDGSDYFLLVGAKTTDLNGLPAGDIVFDPTVDYQVGASSDDAFELSNQAVTINGANANIDAADEYHSFRWLAVTIPDGATIDAATVDAKVYATHVDEPNHVLDFEDSATPGTFTTGSGDISSRTGTTATVQFGDGSDLGMSAGDWFSTGSNEPSVQTIIAELELSYDYSSGLAMVCRMEGTGAGTADLGLYYYDNAAADAAKLSITYTAAGGAVAPTGNIEGPLYGPLGGPI